MYGKSVPLHIKVKDALLQAILTGNIPADGVLPSEDELAQQFHVSRATVRTALSALEREGIITKQRGSRTRVNSGGTTLAFEPLISLSYSLQRLGLDCRSEILEDHIMAAGGVLVSGFGAGTVVRHLKRIRMTGDFPIAVEDAYFSTEYSEFLDRLSPEDSVAHALLSLNGFSVEKVNMQLSMRSPTQRERELLHINGNQRVVELARWIYDSRGHAVNFVDFVIPETVMKYPFSIIASEN